MCFYFVMKTEFIYFSYVVLAFMLARIYMNDFRV